MERGNQPSPEAAAASALQWWIDAGVDVLVDETARDWLRAKPKTEALPPAAPAAPAEILPGQLDLFRAWLATSDTIAFAAPSAPRVCPSGDPASGLMIVADMPSAEDCNAGALVSGEAGRLFDRMLAAIGRDRGSIYLASLACLPSPDGRFTDQTATSCAALARHHIGLAAPRAVLLLGDAASKALLGLPVMKARGRWHQISTHSGETRAMATFPPFFLLDRPAAKAAAWADLQMLQEELDR